MLNVTISDKNFWDNKSDSYLFFMKEGLDSASDLDSLSKIENEFYPNVKKLLSKHKFTGKRGQNYILTAPKNDDLVHFVFIGLGKVDGTWDRELELLRRTWGNAIRQLKYLGVDSAVAALPDAEPFKVESDELLKQLTIVSIMSDYQFTHFKTGDDENKNKELNLLIDVDHENIDAYKKALKHGNAIGKAINDSRHWIDLPANIITPTALSQEAEKIAQEFGLKCTVFGRKKALELGMGAFAAVDAGSDQDGKFIILEHKAKSANAPTIALCGKGVTFDTGGVSLKPAGSMTGMKYDMSGASAVLGIMKAIGQIKPNVNVVALAPAVENMPSGKASRQDDIVRAMNGKSIEIKNTDAEGRLILADALCYAEKFYNPDIILDLATLTGACVVALGHFHAGLMTRDEELQEELITIGKQTGDRVWPLPMTDDYVEGNKSDVADVANVGSRTYGAGSITAGCFLENFVEKARWAHIDIAGVASDVPGVSYVGKGATGAGVRLVLEYIKSLEA